MTGIRIFGYFLPYYGLSLYAGVVFAAIVGAILCIKRKFPFWDLVGAGGYALIGGLLGSKLLFLAVSLKQIIALRPPIEAIIKGGFVFYGGLIGGFLGILIYAKQFKMELMPFLELFAVPLPLGHAFGRIGCFIGGCCYGIPYDGFGCKVYHAASDINTPLETPLLPVQLISSAGLFCLFVALLNVFMRSKKKGAAFYGYAFAYPVLRFSVEFLRGDTERGIFFGLSTAQWVSLTIVSGFTIFLLVRKKKSAKK